MAVIGAMPQSSSNGCTGRASMPVDDFCLQQYLRITDSSDNHSNIHMTLSPSSALPPPPAAQLQRILSSDPANGGADHRNFIYSSPTSSSRHQRKSFGAKQHGRWVSPQHTSTRNMAHNNIVAAGGINSFFGHKHVFGGRQTPTTNQSKKDLKRAAANGTAIPDRVLNNSTRNSSAVSVSSITLPVSPTASSGALGVQGEEWQTQFFKTKLCPYNLEGRCINGSGCRFAHTQSELRPLPDLHRTKLCESYVRKEPCRNGSCPFAHNPCELRTSSYSFYKVNLCNFYKKGRCWNGMHCRFAHGTAELQALSDEAASKDSAQIRDDKAGYHEDGILTQSYSMNRAWLPDVASVRPSIRNSVDSTCIDDMYSLDTSSSTPSGLNDYYLKVRAAVASVGISDSRSNRVLASSNKYTYATGDVGSPCSNTQNAHEQQQQQQLESTGHGTPSDLQGSLTTLMRLLTCGSPSIPTAGNSPQVVACDGVLNLTPQQAELTSHVVGSLKEQEPRWLIEMLKKLRIQGHTVANSSTRDPSVALQENQAQQPAGIDSNQWTMQQGEMNVFESSVASTPRESHPSLNVLPLLTNVTFNQHWPHNRVPSQQHIEHPIDSHNLPPTDVHSPHIDEESNRFTISFDKLVSFVDADEMPRRAGLATDTSSEDVQQQPSLAAAEPASPVLASDECLVGYSQSKWKPDSIQSDDGTPSPQMTTPTLRRLMLEPAGTKFLSPSNAASLTPSQSYRLSNRRLTRMTSADKRDYRYEEQLYHQHYRGPSSVAPLRSMENRTFSNQ